MNDLTGKTILLIGGTGSFGTAFLQHLLKKHNPGRIIIFSRDEQKQYELSTSLSKEAKTKVSFLIGDIRDAEKINTAMHKVHFVIYAAAMKHMPIAESNPDECYKTNILGTQNVVQAALVNEVKGLVALSTDKAVLPINVYGASKLFLEKLVIHANQSPLNRGTRLSVVRYANVLGSRGSVVPFFQKIKHTGVLPITDMRMTRFSITMQQGVDIVQYALDNQLGGEVFVPKTPSYKISTVAEAVAPECKTEIVGMRNGEKLSELLMSGFESGRSVELDNCYIILPEGSDQRADYIRKNGGKAVPSGFAYDSETNTEWLDSPTLRAQIEALKS